MKYNNKNVKLKQNSFKWFFGDIATICECVDCVMTGYDI